jgi:hypothetical protein
MKKWNPASPYLVLVCVISISRARRGEELSGEYGVIGGLIRCKPKVSKYFDLLRECFGMTPKMETPSTSASAKLSPRSQLALDKQQIAAGIAPALILVITAYTQNDDRRGHYCPQDALMSLPNDCSLALSLSESMAASLGHGRFHSQHPPSPKRTTFGETSKTQQVD